MMNDQQSTEKPASPHETRVRRHWEQVTEGPFPGMHATLERVPGYLSVQEAAHWIGVSVRTIYGYIATGKLNALRVGSILAVSVEDIRGYQRHAPDQQRAPTWCAPAKNTQQFLTSIMVCLRPGQDERLEEKLQEICATGTHQLPGTVARYLTRSQERPDQVQITLVW